MPRLVVTAGALLLLALPAGGKAALIKDNLYGVRALSASEVWAVGNFGNIFHTADAGKTWENRDSGTKSPLFGIDFVDAKQGWAVGKAALVLHTTDGGTTWRVEKTPIPPEKHFFNVKVVDARTVWAVGDWGAIAVTHDAGQTWEDRSIEDDAVLYDVSFPDPQHGFIAGEFGTVLATADGGRSWAKRDVGTEKTLFGVSFSTPDTGWVVGIDGLILRTGDGGHTWQRQHGAAEAQSVEEMSFLETVKNPGFYSVSVVGQYGVVVGDTGSLFATSDGGNTWTKRELPAKNRLVWLRGASVVAGSRGFVVGSSGFSALVDHDEVVLPTP